MLPKAENACFLIADISGYTSYLAGVELEHAQDIIADLMDTVVRCLRPPFKLAKFEGDAAFLYAVGDKVRRFAAPGRDRIGVFRVPQAAAQHRARRRPANARPATACSISTSSSSATMASSSGKAWPAARSSPAAMSSWFIAC